MKILAHGDRHCYAYLHSSLALELTYIRGRGGWCLLVEVEFIFVWLFPISGKLTRRAPSRQRMNGGDAHILHVQHSIIILAIHRHVLAATWLYDVSQTPIWTINYHQKFLCWQPKSCHFPYLHPQAILISLIFQTQTFVAAQPLISLAICVIVIVIRVGGGVLWGKDVLVIRTELNNKSHNGWGIDIYTCCWMHSLDPKDRHIDRQTARQSTTCSWEVHLPVDGGDSRIITLPNHKLQRVVFLSFLDLDIFVVFVPDSLEWVHFRCGHPQMKR